MEQQGPNRDLSPAPYNLPPSTHSNVYVKHLPPDFEDATLHAIFSPYGAIDSCRVVRSAKTHASKGYGFVKFGSVEQAQNAITAVNAGAVGAGLQLEAKFADADAGPPLTSTGQIPSDNLYVRNLPLNWGEPELAHLFAPYGLVQECRILHAGDAVRSSGALVRLGSVVEAGNAIEALHNKMLPGMVQPLLVRFADSAEEKARKQALKERGGARNNAAAAGAGMRFPLGDGQQGPVGLAPYLGGGPASGPVKLSSLPAGFSAFNSSGIPDTPSIAQQALRQQHFVDAFAAQQNSGLAYMGEEEGDYGPIDSSSYPGSLPYPPGSPIPPGVYAAEASPPYTAFAPVYTSAAGALPVPVQFTDPGAAAMYGRGGAAAGGIGTLAGNSGLGTSLYIKNLPPEADKLYLYERFAAHGAVQSVKVLVDEQTGQCRGVGFVNYLDTTSALSAINALHGVKVGDKLLYVSLQTHRGRSGAGGSM